VYVGLPAASYPCILPSIIWFGLRPASWALGFRTASIVVWHQVLAALLRWLALIASTQIDLFKETEAAPLGYIEASGFVLFSYGVLSTLTHLYSSQWRSAGLY